MAFLLVCSCGKKNPYQNGIYEILFDPSPATISSGICSSDITIIGDLDYNVILLTSQITVTDSDNPDNTVSYLDDDMTGMFGTSILPIAGLLEGTLTVDGAGAGMSGAFDVIYIIFGTASNGYPRNFVGFLGCNE